MKKLAVCAGALAALFVYPAVANDAVIPSSALQLVQSDRYDRDGNYDRRPDREWRRGERLPREFMRGDYAFSRWEEARLPPPPRSFRWYLIGDQFVLVSVRNREIRRVVDAPPPWSRRGDRRGDRDGRFDRDDRGDRGERWQQRYRRTYTVQDDPFYRECRTEPDPAGALVGAFLGGVIGNMAGNRRNQTATTFAGIIAGGAIGASLTSKLNCDDRSYAYKTYMNGFASGRANSYHDWQNPRTGNRGRLHVLDYYEDEDNFRCAVYSQEVFINGRPEEARGRACQQPDGTWALID